MAPDCVECFCCVSSGLTTSTPSEFRSLTGSPRTRGKWSSPNLCLRSSTITGPWWWTSLKRVFLNSTTRWPQTRKPNNPQEVRVRAVSLLPVSSLVSFSTCRDTNYHSHSSLSFFTLAFKMQLKVETVAAFKDAFFIPGKWGHVFL